MNLVRTARYSSLWLKLTILLGSILFLVLFLILDYSWIVSILITNSLTILVSFYLVLSGNECSHRDTEFDRDSTRSWDWCINCKRALNVEVLE